MPPVNRFSVTFLPWLELTQEVIVGDFCFWPFRKLASQKVADPQTRQHLDKVFETYVQPEPFPPKPRRTVRVSEVTVVTGHDYSFSSGLDAAAVVQAKNALAFAFIDSNNDNNWCTSENFELVRLEFYPGDPNIGYRAGEIARLDSLGWQLGEVLFQRPIFVNGHYNPKCDDDLLRALSFALSNSSSPEVQTILRALDYFAQAYTNSGDVRKDLRIVLMSVLFEILLDLDIRNSREDFRAKIHATCGDAMEPTAPYQIIHTGTGRVITTEQLTAKQVWAEEFYKLRNKIVHGDQLIDQDFLFHGQSHFWLAVLFFRICIRKRLEGISAAGYKCTDGICQNNKGEFEFDFWAI